MKVSSEWNKERKVTFTIQDPCQIIRKGEGDVIADDLRFVIESVVGKENVIEMTPNKSNNYCCGGGGGFLQSGFTAERRAYGKVKHDQIMQTKADYCITGCHNCHAQVHDVGHEFGGSYNTVHIWTLICLSLGILGPNERTYLGDDLKDVDVFHPESSLF